MKNLFLIKELNKLNVIDENKVLEYINFCLENDEKCKTKFETASHHILPKSIFKEFACLKTNLWNSVHLTHKNHYIAHSILAEAINEKEIIYAWKRMNNSNNYFGIIDSKIYEILSTRFAKIAGKHWIQTLPVLENGKIIRKHKDEIQKNDKILFKDVKLVKNSLNEKVWVDIGEIDNSYTHLMKGKRHTSETKRKISEVRTLKQLSKGVNNNSAKVFEIYNSNNKLITVVKGDLKNFAKQYNIPFGSIRKALDKNNGILYKDSIRESDITVLKIMER